MENFTRKINCFAPLQTLNLSLQRFPTAHSLCLLTGCFQELPQKDDTAHPLLAAQIMSVCCSLPMTSLPYCNIPKETRGFWR